MRLRPRHLNRYRQIAEIMADHGFGAVLAQLGLSDRLNLPRRILRRRPTPDEELTQATRLRMSLEDLGPTFVKLGQILSTRSDLAPPNVLEELRRLQDDVAPITWEAAKSVVEDELGAPIEDLFAFINPQPIASASIAQVHGAILLSGEEVVVKIQRPDIEKTIGLDLDILYDLAQLAQERTSVGERYQVSELADEFAHALQGELDFRREGRSADRFRENFAEEEHLHVPEVYWEYTTRRVLVMERLSGIKIDDIAGLDAAGYDRRRLAEYAADLVLKEVLEDGFFHADPHPGNLLVLPGEVIGVLDFGTVGRLDTRDRINLARLFVVVVQLDAEGIVEQLMRMGIADYNVDRHDLTRDLRRLLIRYQGLPLYEISAGEVLDYLEPVIYQHKLHIPSDYWLLIKTIVIMQGVGLGLDPEFDIFEAARPYLGRVFRQLVSPNTWLPSLVRMGTDWGDFVTSFPRQSTRILEQVERGDLNVQIQVPDLRELTDRLDRIVNRIIYGVLIAAIAVALALLLPNLDLTWPWGLITWIILLTFVVVSILGLQLVWSIFRSRRRRK